VFLLALAVNLLTAAPTVLEGDGAELQATALLGGVPHPSGYPSFVLLGQLFGRLLPGDPAFRITAMCAAFGAATLVVFVLLSLELGASLGAAVAGAAVYGASSPCAGRRSAPRSTRWPSCSRRWPCGARRSRSAPAAPATA
jgi:hypothetical protein